MGTLGSAIHACLALSFTDPAHPVVIKDIERTLQSFGVADCISSNGVLRQSRALQEWIANRWPGATASAEYPVQEILDSGQILNGRIDLLLDTTDGWILIDHKSSQLSAAHWEQLANEYGAQLASYAHAIGAATSRNVTETWLLLPVAGGAVRLGPGL
jgi:ATP-dependent exoDNAse (exonuclease V) beta subunit